MPQTVRLDGIAESLPRSNLSEPLVPFPRVYMVRARLIREQPVRMPVRRPHPAQIAQQHRRERRQPLLILLAHHANDSPRAVNVLDRDRHRFPDAQPAAIHDGEHAPVHR